MLPQNQKRSNEIAWCFIKSPDKSDKMYFNVVSYCTPRGDIILRKTMKILNREEKTFKIVKMHWIFLKNKPTYQSLEI